MLLRAVIINQLIFPEALLIFLLASVLLSNLLIGDKYKAIIYCLIQAGLVAVLAAIFANIKALNNHLDLKEENLFLLNNGFWINQQINYFKAALVGVFCLILTYGHWFISVNQRNYAEQLWLKLLVLLGAMLTISSCNLLNWHLALEVMHIPVMGLIVTGNRDISLAGIRKQVAVGVVISGIGIYGISLIYGGTGSLDIKSIVELIVLGNNSKLLVIGAGFLFASIIARLNLFPLHSIFADFQEIANPIVGMLIISLPTLAIFYSLGYLVENLFCQILGDSCQALLIVVGITTIIFGNIGAILQHRLKRLIAFATTAHTGLMSLGLATSNEVSLIQINWYAIAYYLLVIVFWGTCTKLFYSNTHNNPNICLQDLHGLSRTDPCKSILLAMLLLAVVGAPPTIGFYIKCLIAKNLIMLKLTPIAIAGLLCSAISWGYCIKILHRVFD